MSERPEITRILSKSIQKHICPENDQRIYWAREGKKENVCKDNAKEDN